MNLTPFVLMLSDLALLIQLEMMYSLPHYLRLIHKFIITSANHRS